MRAKVIVSASALALLVLAPAIYYRFAPSSAPAQPSSQQDAGTDTGASPALRPSGSRPIWAVTAHQTDDVPLPDAESDPGDSTLHDPVLARIAQLNDLGTSNDPASLKTILSELNNQNQRIRKAALDATIQFKSPDAIPTLRNELNWAEDPREKVAIQDAIDFLQLPSASSVKDEYMAQQQGQQPDAQPAN